MKSYMQVNKARLAISIEPGFYERVTALGKGRRGGRSGVIEDCLSQSLFAMEDPKSVTGRIDGYMDLSRHTCPTHRTVYLEAIDQLTETLAEQYETAIEDCPEAGF
jgi:hypothetical protein